MGGAKGLALWAGLTAQTPLALWAGLMLLALLALWAGLTAHNQPPCVCVDVQVLLMADILVFLQEKDQKFTFASLVSGLRLFIHLSVHPPVCSSVCLLSSRTSPQWCLLTT